MSVEMGVAEARRLRTVQAVIDGLNPAIDLMQDDGGLEVEAFQARYLRLLLQERLEPGHGRRRPPMPGTGLQVLDGGWPA